VPILSFTDEDTRRLHGTGKSRRFADIAKVALRKLDMLAAAAELTDLRSPHGNRLEALQGDRQGRHAIRINDQWRLCFVWTELGATLVQIADCH
jgi:proteic killer suppression protein